MITACLHAAGECWNQLNLTIADLRVALSSFEGDLAVGAVVQVDKNVRVGEGARVRVLGALDKRAYGGVT